MGKNNTSTLCYPATLDTSVANPSATLRLPLLLACSASGRYRLLEFSLDFSSLSLIALGAKAALAATAGTWQGLQPNQQHFPATGCSGGGGGGKTSAALTNYNTSAATLAMALTSRRPKSIT